MYLFQSKIMGLVYTIGKSIVEPVFIAIILITYLLYRKSLENKEGIKPLNERIGYNVIVSTLQGLLIGGVGSLIILIVGIPLEITRAMGLLLPIALIVSLKNSRFVCFSYACAILGVIKLLVAGKTILGIDMPDFVISIPGMVLLVGVLHLMEAMLVCLLEEKDNIPMITMSKDTDEGLQKAYITRKYWPIALAILIPEVGWYPVFGLLGFGTISRSYEPQKKTKIMGLVLGIYAALVITSAIVAYKNPILELPVLLFMPILHECIYYIDGKLI